MTTHPDLMTMLKRSRLAAGFTQDELARKVGVTQGTVCAWEAGSNLPRPVMFPKLARVLGINPMELTRYISPPSATEGGVT